MELAIFVEPQQGFTHAQVIEAATLADQIGFAGFFMSDHLLTIGPGFAPNITHDAWTLIAEIGQKTNRIHLGTLVTPITFRNPGVLIASVATLSASLAGRLEFGLGCGWYENEHAAFGIRFPPQRDRFEALREYTLVVRHLIDLAPGSAFSFHGEHYSLEGCPSPFDPAISERPRVICGGLGQRRTPSIAVAFADEFNVPPAPVGTAEDQFEVVREIEANGSRMPNTPITYSAGITTCCGRNGHEVEERLDRAANSIGYTPDHIARQGATGTPSVVLSRLDQLANAGAYRAYLQILDLADLDHLELIGERVLPEASRL